MITPPRQESRQASTKRCVGLQGVASVLAARVVSVYSSEFQFKDLLISITEAMLYPAGVRNPKRSTPNYEIDYIKFALTINP